MFEVSKSKVVASPGGIVTSCYVPVKLEEIGCSFVMFRGLASNSYAERLVHPPGVDWRKQTCIPNGKCAFSNGSGGWRGLFLARPGLDAWDMPWRTALPLPTSTQPFCCRVAQDGSRLFCFGLWHGHGNSRAHFLQQSIHCRCTRGIRGRFLLVASSPNLHLF